MLDISNPYVIAFMLALMALILGYAILVPKKTDNFSPEIANSGEDGTAGVRWASKLGNEFYSIMPQSVDFKRGKKDRIEALLIRSGNPWRMNSDEFFFFQFVCAFIGFLASFPVYLALSQATSIPWYIICLATTAFGFMVPRIKYNEQAKMRDLDFKRQLPESLDLINVSLTGGVTFPQALRESIPNMKDGVLKEEFTEILRQIDTGKTTAQALDYFSTRAPNESIRTFINAVREASELNVPLEEVLRQRAQASRAEFFALLNAKVATLNPKIMGILAPTMLGALILIIVSPAGYALMGSLG